MHTPKSNIYNTKHYIFLLEYKVYNLKLKMSHLET